MKLRHTFIVSRTLSLIIFFPIWKKKSILQFSVALMHRYVQFYCHIIPPPQYPTFTQTRVPILCVSRISLHFLNSFPLFCSDSLQQRSVLTSLRHTVLNPSPIFLIINKVIFSCLLNLITHLVL